jgi:type II secretory pathway component GspD/PulD (secretin)
MLEVDVAFVGVTEKESNQIGANLLREGVSFITSIAAARGGSASYSVSSGLNGTLQAIGGSGPGRFKSVGHLTLKNDAADWKFYHDGGTITLPIMGAQGGVGTQPIDYGLILKAKGGLVNAENAAFDLELELSAPILIGMSPGGPIYDVKRSRISSAVQCGIGKTLIMGGTKQLSEGLNVSGTPILEKIPILNFLFSERKQTRDARQVLILMSPQMAPLPTSAPPAVEQTAGTLEQVEKPVTTLGGKKKQ